MTTKKDKAMDIYLITIDEVFYFETFNHKPEAYKDKETARKRYENVVAEAKVAFKEDEWLESEAYSYYETYPDGQWSQNHYAAYFQTIQLQ